MDFYAFYTGQCFDAHESLGAHPVPGGTVFRVFAPGARGVSVLTDAGEHPMQRIYDGNFYELTLPGAGGEAAMVRAAAAESVQLRGLSGYYMAHAEACPPDTVVAGYAALRSGDIPAVAQALGRAWGGAV